MQKLFGLNFYDKSILELIKELELIIEKNRKVSIFTPNIDHIINLYSDIELFKKYSKSEYIIADGWPIVKIAKHKKRKIERITGVDLMDQLLTLADDKEYNIFMLGATDYTVNLAVQNIKKCYKNINLIEYNNGYFDNINDILDKINSSNINILFVGMGSPKQELLIRENFDKLNCNVMLGVGGAFKIYSKEASRAPKIIQDLGLEWLYRFLLEPRRLFKRYFLKYPKFIKLAIRELSA